MKAPMQELLLYFDHPTISATQLRPQAFDCQEAMSDLYRITLHLLCPNHINIEDMVGYKLTCVLKKHATTMIVRRSVVVAVDLHATTQKDMQVTFSLAPEIWYLDQNQDSQIYTDKTVNEIIVSVFENWRQRGLFIRYKLLLTQKYHKEPLVCQFNESAYRFLSRLMERAGLYFYFAQEENHEILIITDDKSCHSPLSKQTLVFHPDQSRDDCAIFQIAICASQVQLEQSVHGHNWYDVARSIHEGTPSCAHVNYDETITTEHAAQCEQKFYTERMQCQRLQYQGQSKAPMQSGAIFSLQGHPTDCFNQRYLAFFVHHRWEVREESGHKGFYRNKFRALKAEQQYRARQKTPIPIMAGVFSGCVEGQGAKIPVLDEQGRMLVSFYFLKTPPRRAFWLWQVQSYGGENQGMQFPLLENTEVLLMFYAGHPHHPMVVATMPNNNQPGLLDIRQPTANRLRSLNGHEITMQDSLISESYLQIANKGGAILLGKPPNSSSSFQDNPVADNFLSSQSLQQDIVYPAGLFTYTHYSNKEILGIKEDVVKGKKVQVVKYDYEKLAGPCIKPRDDNIAYLQLCMGNARKIIDGNLSQRITDEGFEDIGEDYHQEIGEYDKKCYKNSEEIVYKNLIKLVFYNDTQLVTGNKSTGVIGGVFSVYAGGFMPFYLGGTIETRLGVSMRQFLGINVMRECNTIEKKYKPSSLMAKNRNQHNNAKITTANNQDTDTKVASLG